MTATNVDEVIQEKGKRLERLREELEICKVIIEDKMDEVTQLCGEILLLQDLASGQANPAAPSH